MPFPEGELWIMKCPNCLFENPSESAFCSKCGTRIQATAAEIPLPQTKTVRAPLPELTSGATFAGRYQIIEELGRGGMARVYKAFDTKVQEKIALKLIKPEIASDKENIARFDNELRLARKVRHKNVCGMFDLGEAEGGHFITMEYVHGENLKSMIQMMGGLTVGAVLSIGKQVCDGLAEAHSLGVVHRDLKPQNIMIDLGGNAKIMDFGIARSTREKGITDASVLIGTPEYMSPEQAEAKEVDSRSDIYSLGVILYEMATGRVPFEGDTALSIAMKHKEEVPKNPKQFNPNIPDDLSAVILKCLEKNKALRYQAALEVRSELERIEKGLPITERVVPERKPLTSKEITVKFSLKKLLFPGLAVAALVIGAVIIIGRVVPHKAATPAKPARASIAVLPFEDLSPKKEYDYLCKGIPETLINALTNIEGLWVPARTSSFSFEGKKEDAREIGQKLGVDHLLEASIQVFGDRIRITARLVNVNSGSNIWSETYDRRMENIFAIQDDIALAIVKALEVKLLGGKKEPLVKNYTSNSQAYHLFLQGRYFWNKRTTDDLKKAIDYFNQAVELDPHYALAYAGLADAYGTLAFYEARPPKETFSQAEAAAMKALEIDETLAETHSALGLIRMYYDWDWKAAEAELKRAIQTKPGFAAARDWYAEFLTAMGRFEEALAEIRRARELDPLSLIINSFESYVLLYARQYDKAIEQCRKTLELDPNYGVALDVLGFAYLKKGMDKEAIEEYQRRKGDLSMHKFYFAYALPGMREESLRLIEKMKDLRKQGQIRSYPIARVYAGLGDEGPALDWLEKSLEEREPYLIRLNVDPAFDGLRSNPRFKAMLKKIGLE
jgi:TolB-like protein/Tfp pilus assembly protein PilF/tRNA A-37 threonylcarbamoyl transferase component Bud32